MIQNVLEVARITIQWHAARLVRVDKVAPCIDGSACLEFPASN
jgi:hypothetical protein